MKKPEYYYVFIGPFDRVELDKMRPYGEGTIRAYVKEGFKQATGEWPENCSSGWGVTPTQKDEASFWLDSDEMKDMIINSYFYENKQLPDKAHKAWYLLRKKEGHVFPDEK